MKNKLFIVFLFFLCNIVQAQDFDIYPRLKDDNVKMSDLYENTFFDEYQILARDVRMMDMAYSAIVPGYVHFKAKDLITGYSLMGIRLLGYSGLAYNYYHGLGLKHISNLESDIFYSSISLIVGSYLFDWIHGKYRLEKKQEYIRYKYSIKLKLNNLTYNQNNLTPCLSFTYNF